MVTIGALFAILYTFPVVGLKRLYLFLFSTDATAPSATLPFSSHLDPSYTSLSSSRAQVSLIGPLRCFCQSRMGSLQVAIVQLNFFIPKPPFSTPTTRATSKMTDVTAFLPSPVFFHLSRSLQTPFQLTSQCQRALFSIVNFRRCSRRICRRRSPSLHRSWPARPRRCPGLATTRQSVL